MSHEAETFIEAMREELPESPDPRLEADLVARMAATARTEAVTRQTPPPPRARRRTAAWRRAALPARIALASLGLVLSMAGLAVAGVDLPGPVDSSFRGVGIDLPNQGSGDETTPGAEPPGTPPSTNSGSKSAGGHGPGAGTSRGKSKVHGRHGAANGQAGGTPGKSGSAPGHGKPRKGKASPPGQSKSKAKPRAPKPKPAKPAKPQPTQQGNGRGNPG